jgi:hypothetical protein
MLPKILDVLNNTVHRAIIGNRTDGMNHVILDRLKGWVHVLSTFPHQPVQCDECAVAMGEPFKWQVQLNQILCNGRAARHRDTDTKTSMDP